MPPIRVTYRVPAGTRSDAEAMAASLLVEQTVETPPAVSGRYPFVREHLAGRVVRVEPSADGVYCAHLELPTLVAETDPAQLLNVLFGNASIHAGVALEAFTLPDDLLAGYGPRFGVGGLRALCGVADRPLVASALKPAGLTPDELAALARAMGEGGLDLIKDDHYLADAERAPFEARVIAVTRALEAAAQRTGRRTRYAPNLSGTPDAIRRQADAAARLGADAVLVAPMLIGLPTMLELARTCGLPVLAHPAFSGASSMPAPLLVGRLFRLFGADAVIFAGYGGRFAVPPRACRALADEARGPLGGLLPALPVPAGGMTRERAAELVAFYGRDAALLVGGSLLEAGDRLADETRALVEAVATAALALAAPSAPPPSPDAPPDA